MEKVCFKMLESVVNIRCLSWRKDRCEKT